MSGCIEFVLNGAPRRLPAGTRPGQTLLEWLRGPKARLTGTKEGCAEGDCGACTVVVEEPDGTRTPLNACLALLGQMHGRAFRTVEGLRGPDGGPHAVQRAMAQADATQCGFCTPGIVMSAWAHHACQRRHARRRQRRERRASGAGRQSLPLHRLPADPGGLVPGRG
jgi:xanthine dehydrogenase small subunit